MLTMHRGLFGDPHPLVAEDLDQPWRDAARARPLCRARRDFIGGRSEINRGWYGADNYHDRVEPDACSAAPCYLEEHFNEARRAR